MSLPRFRNSQLMRQDLATLIQIPAFERIYNTYGMHPDWSRAPGFATLIHIILEQQVSLASAQAAFDKLTAKLGTVTPDAFLSLDDAELKAVGFSRQKTRYGRILAQAVLDGTLDIPALATADDETVIQELTKLTGIGMWTANVYLLMVLDRPDILPAGDIALQAAAKDVFGLDKRPSGAELTTMAEAWRPYRTLACKLLWHWYLSEKAK